MEFSLEEYLRPEIKQEAERISERLTQCNLERQNLAQKRKENLSEEELLKSLQYQNIEELGIVKAEKSLLEEQIQVLTQSESDYENKLKQSRHDIDHLVKKRRKLKEELQQLKEQRDAIEDDQNRLPEKEKEEIEKAFEKYLTKVQDNIFKMVEILKENHLILKDKEKLKQDKSMYAHYKAYKMLHEVGEKDLVRALYDKIIGAFPHLFKSVKNIEPITLYFSKDNKNTCSLFLPINEEALEKKGVLSTLAFYFLKKLKKHIQSDECLEKTLAGDWLVIQLTDFEEDVFEIKMPDYGDLPFMVEEHCNKLSEVLNNEIS